MNFPNIPLGKACTFLDSMRKPVKESERQHGSYPYFGANGQQGWINDFIFDEPLILLAEDGGHFGSKDKPIAYKIEGKSWVNNHAHVLRPKNNCNIDYLHFVLKFYDVSRFISGTTRAKLTKGKAEIMPIPLPPLEEQKRIAGILTTADRVRQLRRYALEMSESYLQSVFLQMFGDPVTNPMGWEIGRLEDLCEQIVDCPHSTPIYAEKETPYACVRSSDIQNGFFDWATTKYVSHHEYQKRIKRHQPIERDVVYCREGARFGNAARIPKNKIVCLGQRTMLFRANKNSTSEFIWALLESDSLYNQAVQLSGGSASPHVNVGDIKKFRIIKPPIDEQKRFTKIVANYERLLTQQQEAIRQADHLFNTLLLRAFRGEL